MLVHKPPHLSVPFPCSYLPGRTAQFMQLYAEDVNGDELDFFLSAGWRKFGIYYFSPACVDCRECVPIRVSVRDYKPSHSQRRITRKNRDLTVTFGPLRYSDRAFEIYREHSLNRFGRDVEREDFMNGFCVPSCPCLQSEYYLEDKLVAIGFIDRSENALSSVYFAYSTEYLRRGLGIFSVVREIDYARELGLRHYYLGYWIKDNRSMAYKASFRVNERMDWESARWRAGSASSFP
jgi:arginine-tRNA-protein transferase